MYYSAVFITFYNKIVPYICSFKTVWSTKDPCTNIHVHVHAIHVHVHVHAAHAHANRLLSGTFRIVTFSNMNTL